MHSIRRVVPMAALAALALPLSLVPMTARADVGLAGHLAYVTSGGVLNEIDVLTDGTAGVPTRLGPVTAVAAPKTVKVTSVVASNDGLLLAWSEIIYKPSAKYGQLESGVVLVERNLATSENITLKTFNFPLGFAGHTLVTSGAYTRRLVLEPSPHLVKVNDGNAFAVATYDKGIVDVNSTVPPSPKIVEDDHLRLTTFKGHHTQLHEYHVGLDYRSAAANTDVVSTDGSKLIVELGNHQDFEGLGPTSQFDTYSLTNPPSRHHLGQYGTNKEKWRMVGATFVGPKNEVWLALHSGYGSKASGYAVRGVVVRYVAGKWQRMSKTGVAVAGNRAGWVVIQNGTWKPVKRSESGEYRAVPVGDAVLEGPEESHFTLTSVKGAQFVWVG